MEMEIGMAVTRGGGEGRILLQFNGYRLFVWDDEKILEMGISDSLTAL